MSEVDMVVGRTLESFLLPEALEALDPHALAAVGPTLGPAVRPGYGLAVAVAGSRETVERQVRDFCAFCSQANALATMTLAPDQGEAAWRAIREVHVRPTGAQAVVKIAVPIGKTLELFASVERLMQAQQSSGVVTAHAGSGIVRAGFETGAGVPLEKLRDGLATLRREAEACEGSLVVEAAPPALKRGLDAWGTSAVGQSVMRRLKAEFDPQGLMNPGRFVVGI